VAAGTLPERAIGPASAGLQLLEKTQADSTAPITTATTCIGLLMRLPLAIFDMQHTGPQTLAGHSAQRSSTIYYRGIGRICGARRAGESNRTDD
jgi:hypothetical protein